MVSVQTTRETASNSFISNWKFGWYMGNCKTNFRMYALNVSEGCQT